MSIAQYISNLFEQPDSFEDQIQEWKQDGVEKVEISFKDVVDYSSSASPYPSIAPHSPVFHSKGTAYTVEAKPADAGFISDLTSTYSDSAGYLESGKENQEDRDNIEEERESKKQEWGTMLESEGLDVDYAE